MASTDDAPKSIPQVASELWELSTAYAKQETIEPLKGLRGFVMYGFGGALSLGIGVTLLMLGALRALQTETDTTFTGNLSWIPYLIVLVAGLVAGLAVWRFTKRKGSGP